RAADAGAHLRSGFVDPVDWLARHAGSSAAAAERALNTATRVADLPATKAALGSGELSIDQADEIARTEDDCPGSEGEMLAIAKRESLKGLRDKARDKRLNAIGANDLARRQRDARSVRHWRDRLGMTQVRMSLEPHVGVPFANRLDAQTDRVHRAAKKRCRETGEAAEPRDRHAADAFASMTTGGGNGRRGRADVV